MNSITLQLAYIAFFWSLSVHICNIHCCRTLWHSSDSPTVFTFLDIIILPAPEQHSLHTGNIHLYYNCGRNRSLTPVYSCTTLHNDHYIDVNAPYYVKVIVLSSPYDAMWCDVLTRDVNCQEITLLGLAVLILGLIKTRIMT